MKVLKFLVISSFLAAIVTISMSAENIILLFVAVSLIILITSRYSIFRNMGKYVILLTYCISLLFMPGFHLVKNITGEDEGAFGYMMTDLDYEHIMSFSPKVLLITCASWLIISSFRNTGKTKQYEQYEYSPKLLPKNIIYAVFILMYFLSMLTAFWGIGKMGSEDAIILPFHLNGIIVLAKIVFFPIFFAIIVENCILCQKKIPTMYYVLFTGWALLEVFTRLSKSALLNAFLPLGIVLIIYYRPNLKTIIKVATPIFMAFLLLYPIVELMRHSDETSFLEGFKSASKQTEDNTGAGFLLQPLNRNFMIPSYYAKDYNWVNHERLFDFSKAPIILITGGAARYQTVVIDGYPADAINSSGTTGLQDPLLYGGYGLCYIIILLLVLFAFYIDTLFYKKMISIYAALLILLWTFCNNQNITQFTDSVGLQYIIMRLFAIWLAYRINFRRKTVTRIRTIK